MKQHLAVLGLALAGVLLLCGQHAHALAGPGANDVQDSLPAWASNGADLAFERTAPGLQHVLATTAAGNSAFVASSRGLLRGYVPGTTHLLVQVGGETLVLTGSRFDRPLATLPGTDAAASPDGASVAYLRDGTLYAAATDDAGERALATGVLPAPSDAVGPAWSPDGTRIAIASGAALLLVQADGSGGRVVADGANPSWSPDGSTIAFERDSVVRVVGADGSGERTVAAGRFPQFSPASNTLAYISDRQHVMGGATRYQFALYTQPLSAGTARRLVGDVHPYSPPRWSPSGAQLAVAAGQECRRWGVYVVATNGGPAHRRSNICRFDGTPHADTIRGSQFFDIVNGLGGSDLIRGNGGNDKLAGDDGNDTILGGAGNDFILAGPGDDRVFGGPGNDTIIGGNGRDRIDCGPGLDTVEAAGRLDRIARNCERVRH